jgi:hypothetical protein
MAATLNLSGNRSGMQKYILYGGMPWLILITDEYIF